MGPNAESSTPWMETLASVAGPKTGPFKTRRIVTHKDKTGRLSFANIVAILEYTLTAGLHSLEDTRKRSQPPNRKLLQLLNNVKSVLHQHPSADFALGFVIDLERAHAVKVDNEVVRIVELDKRRDDINRSKMVALLRIFLNFDDVFSGFSNGFNCTYTPDSGFNETALRNAPEFVKVSSLDCIPPGVLAHSGSATYATFKLDTPPVLLPQLGSSDDIPTTTDDSSTSTPASPHLYQL
ncbi:BZ3500_MvSof-1268-A1-R1_Chr7-1g09088 [Microbotryum saponariae]|uniref:BZ3500_MvSof-1268-A1-R1_Chr7-1g09088 protein n=1 Tax=Microbotryum saponariae TaxID=289078 RepID=A0A2X0MV82_9BASI|nr:BZ3501_MvSof-1269-A2-R1_Chr7-1g08793 [Microbotryum saponariae]SDA02778.1 BZ3500_MvSof-1268-A1-R1_Chr7-1g09088 [Microbotryum saponariae]